MRVSSSVLLESGPSTLCDSALQGGACAAESSPEPGVILSLSLGSVSTEEG